MAAQKKKKNPPTELDAIPVEQRTEAQQLGIAIHQERPDLLPSVRRILEADLSDAQRLTALELFQASLSDPADPNRDPRVAIAAAA